MIDRSPALRRLLSSAALLVALFPLLCRAAETPPLEDDIAACRADPVNRVGGAAIGDCLLERSAEVDHRIGDLLTHAAQRFCRQTDRDDLLSAQRDWAAHRETQCELLRRSPDNTPSFVNGAACRLLLGRRRLESLRLLVDFANPRCPAMSLNESASRFGLPGGGVVAIPGSDLSWQLTGKGGERELNVLATATGRSIARLAVECAFCEGTDDNCAKDGVFVLQEAEDPARPYLFHVCHVGAHSQRLVLIDPTVHGAEPQLRITGRYFVDWSVAGGRLRVIADDDGPGTYLWPAD